MFIHDLAGKIKSRLERQGREEGLTAVMEFDEKGEMVRHSVWDKFFLSCLILLVALLFFGLGRLTKTGDSSAIKIEYDSSLLGGENQTTSALNARGTPQIGPTEVVTSSKGTKYHYSHCPGAKQISEKNRITFQSAAAAEAAGFTLAANCKPR